MSQQLFANNAGSTLAGAITNVSTIANLAAGTGALFPSLGAGQYFVATFVDAATGLINEIVWVTSRTGDQITIVRAQESTTAKTWNSGDLFKMLVTAGTLGQMLQNGQFPEQAFVHTGTDTGGSSNTIVATLTPSITQYDVGAVYQVKLLHDITGASTVNLDGVGAVALKRSDGTDTQSGDGYAGNIINVSWNGTTAQLMSLAPATGQFFAASVTGLQIIPSSPTVVAASASRVTMANSTNTKTQTTNAPNVSINSAVNGANGLDAGSLAASTWYYVWLIGNGTLTAGLLSLSSTAPTLPSGYTFTKYCGAVRTDGSAHFMSSLQKGNAAQWTSPQVMGSGTNGSLVGPSWVAIAVANFVPPTASRLRGYGHTSNGQLMVAPNNGYGAYTSTTTPPPLVLTPLGVDSVPFDFELESTNVYWASNDSSGANPTQLLALGWTDGSL